MKNLKQTLKNIFTIPEENEMSAKFRYAQTEKKPTIERVKETVMSDRKRDEMETEAVIF